MNRLLHSLLRPSAYGATALAVAVVAAQSEGHQQEQQKDKPIQYTPSSIRSGLIPTVTARTQTAGQAAEQVQRNQRWERFNDFASVEYNGVPYMTPKDFLESVTREQSSYRQGRRALSKPELDRILSKTPSSWWASTKLMRSLGQEGIVSYPEYLFLLCTLANPKSGFAIAFNMIDRSRNQSLEKSEFSTLNAMVSECPVSEVRMQDTTLMRHFFGRSGNGSLNYTDFVKFMTNLQYEVLEIEFLKFSKGLSTIPESDFIRVLLRYSNLSEVEQTRRVEQLKMKLIHEEGINFEDFRLFFQFINSLQDLAMALRMFALAGHSVTQEEFQRAVKACVGYTLAPIVVSTVFLLLDKDGDGSLSSEELLGILRGRLRRLNSKAKSDSVPLVGEFKQCLKRELQKDL